MWSFLCQQLHVAKKTGLLSWYWQCQEIDIWEIIGEEMLRIKEELESFLWPHRPKVMKIRIFLMQNQMKKETLYNVGWRMDIEDWDTRFFVAIFGPFLIVQMWNMLLKLMTALNLTWINYSTNLMTIKLTGRTWSHVLPWVLVSR